MRANKAKSIVSYTYCFSLQESPHTADVGPTGNLRSATAPRMRRTYKMQIFWFGHTG
jgi:hypothetical protein